MITGAILKYMFDWRFIIQLVATLATCLALRIVRMYIVRRRRFKLMREYCNIPGPELSIFHGNYLFDSKTKMYQMCDWMKNYPKACSFFIGDEPNLFVTDLDLLKKIFFENSESFKLRGELYVEVPMGHGILFAGFNRWKQMRKMFSPSFSKFNMRNDRSARFIEESISLMLKYMENKLDHAKAGEPQSDVTGNTKARLDIHSLLKSTALHMISTMAVRLPDVDVKENEPHVKGLDGYLHSADKGAAIWAIFFPFLKGLFSYLANNFEYSAILSLITKGVNKTLDEGLQKLKDVDQGISEPNNDEDDQLVDTMIKLHHKGVLSRLEVVGNVDAALYAGYDTTATTLAYCFWVLAKFPEIQDKARDELKAHGAESHYLEQVLNETMRLYPVAPAFTCRQCTSSVKIDDYLILKDVKVIYHQWFMHRNPEFWPDPLRFDPDRFAPGKVIHPCAWAPFGLAERKCIGYKLAYLEMKMIVCDILLRYKLSLVQPEELKLETYAFTLTKPTKKILLDIERL